MVKSEQIQSINVRELEAGDILHAYGTPGYRVVSVVKDELTVRFSFVLNGTDGGEVRRSHCRHWETLAIEAREQTVVNVEQNPGYFEQNAHQLMPAHIRVTFPGPGETEHLDDPIVSLKWFTPDSSWTWYVLEYDPETRICFGLVDGFEVEMGDFSLDELQEVRGPRGLKIERDLHFEPKPLSVVRAGLDRR